MFNRRVHNTKKGGYTLFSDKTKKMLLSAGISMLSVCALTNVASATPKIEGKVYTKTNGDKVLYQIEAKEEAKENDREFELDDIYIVTTTDGKEIETKAKKLFWQKSSDEKTILAVIEADENATIRIKNNDKRKEKPGADDNLPDNYYDIKKENDIQAYTQSNPLKLLWAYKNKEEKYVQFKVGYEGNAECQPIINEIVRKDGDIELVTKVSEKDQGKEVVARYDYENLDKEVTDATETDDDTSFMVRNIFGDELSINIENINVTYTIAAKDADGSRVVLNMVLPEGAKLLSLETVNGIDILTSADVDKEWPGKDLVNIYTDVPAGTTFLTLKYKVGEEEIEIPVALKLDLTSPEVVQRNADGNRVDANGTARIYKNDKCTKAIVEISDVLSGIKKISVFKDGDECVELTQKFELSNLPTSVVQLMDLPAGATSIKIYDGMGNIKDISLEDVSIDAGAGLSLDFALDMEDENAKSMIVTYQDNKSGLHKFLRSKEINADREPKQALIAINCEAEYAPKVEDEVNLYKTVEGKKEIEKNYIVTEDKKTIVEANWQGVPEFTIVSALGNKKEFNINEIMFTLDKVYLSKTDDEDPVVKAISVDAHDLRRIKKITAEINDEEVVLDTFEVKGGTIQGPVDVSKAYELPDGAHLTKITFYHYDGDVTQNEKVIDLTIDDPEVETIPDDSDEDIDPDYGDAIEGGATVIDKDGNPTIVPTVTLRIAAGIEYIEYSDGCTIEFYDDLPKEVEIYQYDKSFKELEYILVRDGLKQEYNVAVGSEDLARFSSVREAQQP
ncbi:MAG: hypothetical protein J6Y29_06890 [Clostridiales bacterium]|nr:hypothetical protein [Clostridiales bacterium]